MYTTCTLELKGAVLQNLAFQDFVERTRRGAGEEKDIIWNELGQGGGQERREAALEMRKYRWSRVEVRKFDLGCMNAVPKMKHQDTWHGKGS